MACIPIENCSNTGLMGGCSYYYPPENCTYCCSPFDFICTPCDVWGGYGSEVIGITILIVLIISLWIVLYVLPRGVVK